jgi:hypothetical protein
MAKFIWPPFFKGKKGPSASRILDLFRDLEVLRGRGGGRARRGGEGGGNLKTEGEGPTVHQGEYSLQPCNCDTQPSQGCPQTARYRGLCIDRGIDKRGVHQESIAFNPVIVTPMALTGASTDRQL